MRRALALLAACLAGAAGLGLEILLLQCAGLALGQGRAAAWGLALFVGGWALGAFTAGRARGLPAFWIAGAGFLMPFLAAGAVELVLHAALLPSQWQADLLCAAAIGAVAFAQGLFLPLLLRGRDPAGPWIDSAAALVAANLLGSLAGAWLFSQAEERSDGAFAAGEIAAFAGIAGALALAKSGRPAPALGPIAWRAGSALALATLWTLALEYAGLRLVVLWVGGMQHALGAALVASVAGLALGAALLPPLLPRGERGVLLLLALALLAGTWPSFAQAALAQVDPAGDPLGIARAAVLLVPALFPLGAFPAVLHRTLAGDGGERLGALYLHEAWGALLGLPLLHAFVLPRLGIEGLLAVAAPVGIAIAACFARSSRVLAGSCALLALASAAVLIARGPPALDSPPLAQPALALRSFREDRDFAVSVVDDGILGERTLLTDGFRAAGTGRDYTYMQVLGHLPLLLHPHPERVAVLALGTGTTLGAVAQHPEVREIEVLEISQAVVDAAPLFEAKNHGVLNPGATDPRVRVRLADGRRTLANHPASYDVITMEPLLPDSPFGVYLYTEEFYEIARRALRPGGLVCQWVPPHALEPQVFQAVLRAFEDSFPWSGTWLFGTQVILVGGESVPDLLPARFDPALAVLGLDTPQALAARCVRCRAGVRLEIGARPLTDDEPWILYLPRRSGSVLLGDLPANLRALRATPSLPELWHADAQLNEGMRALRLARERTAIEEARLRGLALEQPQAEPGPLPADDPEVRAFAEEREFLAVLRRGVAALASDPASALPDLVRAAELRGERADVHLYLALALERTGNPLAGKALATALERCPAIARTTQGQRARQLGLSDAAWEKLERSAQELR